MKSMPIRHGKPLLIKRGAKTCPSSSTLDIMNIFIVTLLVSLSLITGTTASASDEPCSTLDAYAARTVTGYLNNWENVYVFFKQFYQCYDASIAEDADAAIAEGAEDSIQNLWIDHWSDIPQMIILANRDPKFKAFIWQRISDDTFPQDGFNQFVQNARKKCPKVAAEFCSAVILEATKGLLPNTSTEIDEPDSMTTYLGEQLPPK